MKFFSAAKFRLLLMLLSLLPPSAALTQTSVPFTLTLLHNNDAESQLVSAEGQPNFGGAARFKALVDQVRNAALLNGDAVVAVTSGDNYIPSPEFNASLVLNAGEPLYDARLIDAVGYDALCLGNHDFDFGPAILQRMISDASASAPTFLSANLDFSGEAGLQALVNAGRIAPSKIVVKNGRQIGIIGLTTPDLATISSPGNVIVGQNVANAVQTQVAALQAAGVNIIILISHLQGIAEDLALIPQISGVDIVVAGGGDELLAKPGTLLVPGDAIQNNYPLFQQDASGTSIPVVTTAGELKYLGRLTASFDAAGNLISIDPASNAIRVSGTAPDAVAPDAAIQATVVDPVAAYLASLNSNILAVTQVDLDGIRNNVRGKETNEGNLIADAFLWQANQLAASFGVPAADVALANGGGIRNNAIIPANSNLTEQTTFNILPFGNLLSMVESVPPQQFKEILENAYSVFEDLTQGGTGRFAQIAGFEVVVNPLARKQIIDISGNIVQTGKRIRSVTLNNGVQIIANGEIVAGAPNVNIATLNFLATGGDQYPIPPAAFTTLGVTDQQALANYLVQALGGTVTASQYPAGGEGRITVEKRFELTLLHNNDAESQLISAEGQPSYGGAARFKALVDQVRNAALTDGEAVVTVTSGDNFLAGPEFNASLDRDPALPYYEAVFIDSVGYDALCLGNHDFDFGPEVLSSLITDASATAPTFLSANLDFSGEPGLQTLVSAGRIASSKVVVKNGQKIGIIGLTTPTLPFVSSPGNVIVNQDVVAEVNAEVASLEAQGVKIIILISHLQGIAEDRALISQIDGIDIAVAGGGDELLAKPGTLLVPGDAIQGPYPSFEEDLSGDSIPVVTTAGELKYLGRLSVVFDGDGNLIEIDQASNAIRVSGAAPDAVTPDPAVQAEVVDSVSAYVANLGANILATTQVDLDGRRSTVRFAESNEGNLIADAFLWQANQLASAYGLAPADVALSNGGGIRNNAIIPAGSNISELSTFNILPFGNLLSMVESVPPQQFKEILENAYSQYNVPNAPGTGRFAQVAGFEVIVDGAAQAQVIDINGSIVTPGNRIVAVTLDNGTQIIANRQVAAGAPNVNIATLNFLANGGDQYPIPPAAFTTLGVTDQQSLASYLVEVLNGTVTAAQYPFGGEGRIQFPSFPAAPTGLAADNGTAFIVPLSWTDNASNEMGYQIWRDGVLIATTGANVSSYLDTVTVFGTPVTYQVAAFNASGTSAPSNTASYQMPASFLALDLSYVCYTPAANQLTWNISNPNSQAHPVIWAQWWSSQRDTVFAAPGNSTFTTVNNPQRAQTFGNDNITGIYYPVENQNSLSDIVFRIPLAQVCSSARFGQRPAAAQGSMMFPGVLNLDRQAAIEASLAVSPSPFTDVLRIETPVAPESAEIRILNPMGQTVLAQRADLSQAAELNLSHLAAGVYILNVAVEGTVVSRKIVKQ